MDFSKPFVVLPPASEKPYAEARSYLEENGIPPAVITRMENEGIFYEAGWNKSAVFVNPQKDYAEFHERSKNGTHIRICRTSPTRFWYITNGKGKPVWAYICETAIDAISLMLLREKAGDPEPSVFISIGDPNSQEAVSRIKTQMQAVIAFSNSPEGQEGHARNNDCYSIKPVFLAWKEDLAKGIITGACG